MGNIIRKFEDFSLNEKKKSGESDEDKYLTAGQKKLPEGMKKSIIAKMKKSGKTVSDKEVVEKEKDDNKDSKPKESSISKSDEDKYLTAGQKKLPEGLKKSIIARKKNA
jgi:hypothetical protein